VIATASYNGKPPDNAANFCKWLQNPSQPADAFAGVEYTVFGCGNRDWFATYQAVPKLIDDQLAKHGATRMYERGEGDARGDFDGEYRAWYTPLWEAVAKEMSLPDSVAESGPTGQRFSVAFVNRQAANPVITSYCAVPMTVRVNRELQNTESERPSDRSTRHIEIALPAGVTYAAGDHLGVVPRNGVELFRRVLLHYKLDPSLYVRITPNAGVTNHLPVNEPVPLIELLANRVELQDVATRPQIATLASYTEDQAQRDALLAMAGDDDESQARYRDQVSQTRKSVLDLLDQFPACLLPFDAYLDVLPPLRPRYYSISSSALVAPDTCSITVAVVEGPVRSGNGVFKGVASNYLRA
jgi:cytochrome P450/NADPH-cytochrome P450 reductase